MPIRLWGVDPMFPRDDWKCLYELTEKHELEIIRSWHPSGQEQPACACETEVKEGPVRPDGSQEVTAITRTPGGPLRQVSVRFADGSPGRVVKHPVETVQDAERMLSVPEETALPGVDSYRKLEAQSGERALLVVGLDEAMYAVQRMMGSEVFGYWLHDERELLRRMIDRAFRKVERQAKHYLSHNLGDAYGWVGPELCIPPLASVKDFREFVFAYDKRIIDLVHAAGKTVWIHCHGDMAPVLEQFIEMGVDCLNPIEPPPVGRITLAEAKKICNRKMTLEGNVEDGAFDTIQSVQMRKLVEETVAEGKPGGCFILCPTSSPTTWPKLPPLAAENYKVFVETAVALREY